MSDWKYHDFHDRIMYCLFRTSLHAKAISEMTGIDEDVLCGYLDEKNPGSIPIKHLLAISGAFDVDINWLTWGSVKK